MKKMFLVGLVLAVAASTGMAGIGIDWHTINGMIQDGLPNNAMPPPGGFLLDSYSAIWQLIYAGANNAIDPINGAAMNEAAWAANDYLNPTGDDELIAQRTIPLGGGASAEAGDDTTWNNWMVNTGGNTVYELLADGGENWWDGGSVYQRIFQCDTIVTEGDPGMHGSAWYLETALMVIDTTYVSGGFAQDFPVADGSVFGVPTYQVSVIPEPATMSLLGLGALVMAIRRRRS